MTTWLELEGLLATVILSHIPAFPKELVDHTVRAVQTMERKSGVTGAERKTVVVAALVSFAPKVDKVMLGHAVDAVVNAGNQAMKHMRLADPLGVEPKPLLPSVVLQPLAHATKATHLLDTRPKV